MAGCGQDFLLFSNNRRIRAQPQPENPNRCTDRNAFRMAPQKITRQSRANNPVARAIVHPFCSAIHEEIRTSMHRFEHVGYADFQQ